MLGKTNVAAQGNMQTKLAHGGGLDAGGAVGLLFVGTIDDLNVVRLVAGHHLVA
jgi:hypothetical protein